MKIPLQVTFRNLEKSAAIEDLIERCAARLDNACPQLISCRVAVERPQKYQNRGNPYRVRIDLRAPHGHELVIRRESSEGDMHDDLHKVLTEAFDAASLDLEEMARRTQRAVKTHVDNVGFVTTVYPEKDYGFITAADGHEVYFHRNSVLRRGFAAIETGTAVRFVEQEGEKGPQASTVRIIRGALRITADGEKEPDPTLAWYESQRRAKLARFA